jgi:lipopolysaccharide export system protein LptA
MKRATSSLSSLFAWTISLLFIALLAQANALWAAGKSNKPRKKSEERITLVHADDWMHDQYANPDAQRFRGHVEFEHSGMRLRCDSAIFFQASNSFEAFGHIHIVQGDTLSITGERLYYDGGEQMAQIRHHVVMKHRGQTLETDSLNYDRLYNFAYFFEGGKLHDGDNVLTSDWGEYHTDTRQSEFNYHVELTNPKFRLVSDTMYYDTQTKWTHIVGPSNIYSGENRIYTTNADYNTQTEQARLYDRSQLYNNTAKMVGDSVYYNKLTGEMEAIGNVVYEDKKSQCTLEGNYCRYNELTGEALSYDRALAKEYSNDKDTLFVHGDTLRLHTFHIGTDSLFRQLHGYYHVRAFRNDIQAVADSMVYHTRLKELTLFRDPIVWSDNRQIVGEVIQVYTNDSTIDSVYVRDQAMLVERLDSLHYNQVAARLMRAYFTNGEITANYADGNVYVVNFPLEKDSTILYQNYTETAKLRMTMEHRRMKRLWAPASKGCFYVAGLAPQERTRLAGFAWFDYIRPTDKDDIFLWRGKKSGTELKPSVRHQAPLQTLKGGSIKQSE